jgi:putative drug exporter of the RND superfamily
VQSGARLDAGIFASLAGFAIRFRWPIVAFWLLAAIALTRALPSLSSVVQANNAQFLPASSPSQQAAQLAVPFRGSNPSGTAILVASRRGVLTAGDTAAFARTEEAVRHVPGVEDVRDAGRSKDGRAVQAVVVVTPAASSDPERSKTVVDDIRSSFASAGGPAGLTFHLTGPLAVSVDSARNTNVGAITRLSLVLVVVLLFVVYRAILAPRVTLLPAALAVVVAGPLIAGLAKTGVAVAPVSQQLLVVLLVGAGSDYGLFLTFRLREELQHGRGPHEALTAAVGRVGQAITYSALTVAAALMALLLAPFGIYRGLGPALALGIAVLLAASLTLTPALLAILGRSTFWPRPPGPGSAQRLLWARVAPAAVRRPVLTLAGGLIVFGGLAAGLTGYKTGGLHASPPSTSDSSAGSAVLAAHFPSATAATNQVLLRFGHPVAADRNLLAQAQSQLASSHVFGSVTGPLGLGAGSAVQPHRRFLSPDGETVQYYAALRAGPVGSTETAAATPQARSALEGVAHATGAEAYGIAGQDAVDSDIYSASNTSLWVVVSVVLVIILVLLALLLRSLVAPWYLTLTVGFSYLASLGFASLVFVRLGGADGLIFVLPLIMFVFSMALGEDYNILVMSRIREEAPRRPNLSEALTTAIGITGGTVTSAGIILAGTFSVLGLVGGGTQAQQLGFSIAFGVLLDTFFVRTLLVPSIAVLLGRWNWWPSALAQVRS